MPADSAAAHAALLSLGSNLSPERHLAAAAHALRARFGAVRFSPVYRTPASGFAGADFLNAAALLRTELAPGALHGWLRALEDAQGRRRDVPRFSDRTLDLDIVLFDDLVTAAPVPLPRPDLLEHAFVLRPCADVAPDWVHPVLGRPLAALLDSVAGARSLQPLPSPPAGF